MKVCSHHKASLKLVFLRSRYACAEHILCWNRVKLHRFLTWPLLKQKEASCFLPGRLFHRIFLWHSFQEQWRFLCLRCRYCLSHSAWCHWCLFDAQDWRVDQLYGKIFSGSKVHFTHLPYWEFFFESTQRELQQSRCLPPCLPLSNNLIEDHLYAALIFVKL